MSYRHGPRNACTALAKRELTGRGSLQFDIPRQTLSLRQVFCDEEDGVLLGFSSDGNFLVYCTTLDSCYEVQWRRVKFQAFHHWREDRDVPKTVFKLRVDGGSSVYGLSTPLEVWQSVDWNLVIAVTTDHLSEERDNSRLCRVVVAPSPMFDDGGLAAAVTSVSFEFRQHALSQKMEKWQLMQLVRGQKNVYHLLVNAGTVVYVLVFHTRRVESNATEVAPRGLGISHLPQKAWYYTPVFPIKFLKSKEHRQNKRYFTVNVECICQHVFDVERFLEEFLATFKALQHCNLVDYDLRLVRVNTLEKTIFMTCVMALAPSLMPSDRSGTRYFRVAVFLSLKLFTGIHHVIRVLKVPGNGDLRQLSRAVAQRFQVDLSARAPPEPTTTSLDNEAFLREESLQELHNPLYPLSISSTTI